MVSKMQFDLEVLLTLLTGIVLLLLMNYFNMTSNTRRANHLLTVRTGNLEAIMH